ncbi:MAG: DsbA family oxidoreductase [Bacillota bacterium]
MQIEVWSDIICPFCYIGKRRLEVALSKFLHREEVTIEYRSFELNPDAQINYDEDNTELLAKKYGTSKEQIIAMNQQLTEQAKEVGLTYHLDKIRPTNTFDAHRLIQFAKQIGKENEMVERLFKAYFTEVRHVGEAKTLIEIAVEVGLDEHEVQSLLNSNQFEADVRAQEQDAQQIGVTGVPFYLINRKYAISGAQPSEAFLEVMEKVWHEEQER